MTPNLIHLSFILRPLLILFLAAAGPSCRMLINAAGGSWEVLKSDIGISAMHMQLMINDRVVMFDRTDFGKSKIDLPNGKCREDPEELAVKKDCTAHSVEYDVVKNTVRPLMVLTDVWCSSGSLSPDGRLIQTGGFNDGDDVVRVFRPCSGCDWEEVGSALARRRWYATNHLLPDGRQIIIGGRAQFNYEFYPKTGSGTKAYNLPFLVETNDKGIENNLYPFVFLNVDGHLFIFANNRAILFDYSKGTVVKTYPEMPDGNPRSYPSTGSAVLLPLKKLQGAIVEAEVLVCGGAPKGSYTSAQSGRFVGALRTCGRIKITDPSPEWVMETMPRARVMGDMLLLPNGDVLIINGASAGSAGWEYGRNPVFNPVLYRPDNQVGSRFEVENPSSIPRMYHSTAILLRDGRVLVGGSNPHQLYEFTGVLFPTELSLEAFSPSYLDPGFANLRPTIISPISQAKLGYGQRVAVRFTVTGTLNGNSVTVTMVAPSFNTHSFSMNQRLLVLGGGSVKALGKSTYEVGVVTPGSGNLAPSGYYLLFVVHQEIPSEGIWVHIQ
ncbi:aldehyde oxidase GLOX-like [Rhododendron vialii]|uniref:aldehyde oxidase GLOX-like n=1 Tax=Rhododendron vialii TaxID=182163 RepID=UPI002660567C|nr:aldehyde oxidase GLOX-like [Rhododendron vialii]